MTDYTKLTKQEINKAIARKLNPKARLGIVKDYCNNPNDWAPLLEELRGLGEVAVTDNGVWLHPYANPWRGRQVLEPKLGKAICILWLMCKGE